MSTYNDNYYKILKMPFDASSDDIKNAYRTLAKIYHPDHGGSEEKFIKLREAYEILSNPVQRELYNKWYIATYITPKSHAKREYTINQFQKHPVCIYNTRTKTTYCEELEIDILKFPISEYTFDNSYYAFEQRNLETRQITICTKQEWQQRIKLDKWNSQKEHFKNIFIGLSIVAFFIYIIFTDYNTPSPPDTEQMEEILMNYTEQPIPKHGSTAYDYQQNNSSILEIKLPKNDTALYYYIKLEDSVTGELAQSVFMHPGTDIEIPVPYGTFTFKYACGDKWYGDTDTFGPYGGYSKSDEYFDFTEEYGHTVTLYPVVNGNLETKNIDFKDF